MALPDPLPAGFLSNLREHIRALFNDGELRDLCQDLNVDYDSLPGLGKGDKARELLDYMENRGRLQELVNRVYELRPHLGLNLGALAEKVIEADAEQQLGLRSLIDQFRKYNEQIIEWKELHNRFNVLLNVFDAFGAQVERIDAREERIDQRQLQLSWQAVYQSLYQILLFAGGLRHIGPPYKETAEALSGPEWAVEISQIRAAIQGHLALRTPSPQATFDNPWWQTLREETSRLEDAIKRYLFLADEELRKTVDDLYDLSAETLWSRV